MIARCAGCLYVHTGTVKAVLARDGLPKGGTDLVTLLRIRTGQMHVKKKYVVVHIDRSEDGPDCHKNELARRFTVCYLSSCFC